MQQLQPKTGLQQREPPRCRRPEAVAPSCGSRDDQQHGHARRLISGRPVAKFSSEPNAGLRGRPVHGARLELPQSGRQISESDDRGRAAAAGQTPQVASGQLPVDRRWLIASRLPDAPFSSSSMSRPSGTQCKRRQSTASGPSQFMHSAVTLPTGRSSSFRTWSPRLASPFAWSAYYRQRRLIISFRFFNLSEKRAVFRT